MVSSALVSVASRAAMRAARPCALRAPQASRPFSDAPSKPAPAKSTLMGRVTGFIVGFGSGMIGAYFLLVREITSSTAKLSEANAKLGERLQALESKLK